MNTDKIYAEQLANEYAPKDTSKVVALRKLDARAKLPANKSMPLRLCSLQKISAGDNQGICS